MLGDDPHLDDILEMLGLKDYVSFVRPRSNTPIKHGVRSGYTNRGCGKPGSPPCPASPTCAQANAAYYRTYREGAA